MSDDFTLDEEPFVLVVPSGATIPINDIPASEWLALKDRVLVVEQKALADLLDTGALAGAADGEVPVYDAGAGTWTPGTVADPLQVDDGLSANRFGPVKIISFQRAFTVYPHASYPTLAVVHPRFGDSADTIAEGNHTHQRLTRAIQPIEPGAYMSGGTRNLATRNVTLPAGKTCTVIATIDMQLRGGDPGPCYYRFNLTINGNTRTSPAGEAGFWVVQGVPGGKPWRHAVTVTGTGAAITVTAEVSYHSGGGFYTDAGDLEVLVDYDR